MKINTKEKYLKFWKERMKVSSKREALPKGKKKHRKILNRKSKIRRKSRPYISGKIYTLHDIWMLRRKFMKLEVAYERVEGQPIRQARIEKSASSVQAKLEALGVTS